MKPIDFKEYKKRLFKKDPELKQAYDDLEPEYEIIRAVIRQRIKHGLTQKQLAKKIGSGQAVISRLEQGNYNPSVKFLKKVARALNAKLKITIS